jgi:hypothetical protein
MFARCSSSVPFVTSQARSSPDFVHPPVGADVSSTISSSRRRLGAPKGHERSVSGPAPGEVVRRIISIFP